MAKAALHKPVPVTVGDLVVLHRRHMQARMRTMVNDLAAAIERGECTPKRIELMAIAQLCEKRDLPNEAARVRRWLGTR